MQADHVQPIFVAVYIPKSLDQQLHHLRSRQKSSAKAQRDPLPGLPRMAAKKIIEDAERSRWQDDTQPLDDSLQRLPERVGPGHGSKHDEKHGRERKEHVQRDGLGERDATGNDTEYGSIESMQEL
jgi:hypothetical protein